MHPTEDHYATLGIPPRSEASAIRAAYLDLMRRFHPDRNDSPEAVERAHAIIAAFAVLGNVEQRLHYDWGRRRAADAAAEAQRRRPAMIRKAAISAALVALVLVPLSFLALPITEPIAPAPRPDSSVIANKPAPALSAQAIAAPALAGMQRAAPLEEKVPKPLPPAPSLAAEPKPELEKVPSLSAPTPQIVQPRERRPTRDKVEARPQLARANSRCRSAAPGAEAAVCNNDNLAALDRSVVAFYNQSLQFGAVTKRGPLLDARIGFLLKREECRSDACLQSLHLAHLRELAAIVEKREPEPPR